MNVNCRFSSCQWCGSESEILRHIKSCHKQFFRKGDISLKLSSNDLLQETLVLRTPDGLYWLMKDLNSTRSDGIDFGLFHIGGSKRLQYGMKLKRIRRCEYLGPYRSQPDSAYQKEYELKIDLKDLQTYSFRLDFMQYCDYDCKICYGEPDSERNVEERLKRLVAEQFTCPVCFKKVRSNASFCKNSHFVCLHCFDHIKQHRPTLICPTCRGEFWHDCIEHNIEDLIRTVKLSDTAQEEITELTEKLRIL